MQTYRTLDDAIALAEFAHRSQVDKAGLPYIDHPKRVLAKVQAQGALPYVQIAAILHDVTEDTRFTADMLLHLGFSEAAVNLIKLVDRNISQREYEFLVSNRDRYIFDASLSDSGYDAVDYDRDFLLGALDKDEFYYFNIRENVSAKMLKLADIADNMEPWRLSYFSSESRQRKIAKYTKAREVLAGVLS